MTNGSITTRNKLYEKVKKTKIDTPSYITKETNDFNIYRNTLNKSISNAMCVLIDTTHLYRMYCLYKNKFILYKHDMKKRRVISLKL